MGLHWAWAFGISGSNQNYWDFGWAFSVTWSNPNYSAAPFPRHPEVGYGGMTKGTNVPTNQWLTTCPFPRGPLSDGQIQFHLYGGMRNTDSRLSLLSETGVVLLDIRPSTSSTNPVLNVYSGEGAMDFRGTTTGTIQDGQWNTIGIRFKVGTSGGEIAVSINGSSETIVSNGNVGATSSWARLFCLARLNYSYLTGITVWDDGPNDDALTVTRWVAGLRAKSDSSVGSWTASNGSDLYAMVDDDPISTTDYCASTTDPNELRFGVQTSDINASWFPDTVDGVGVIASSRGDGALNTGQPVIDDGSNNLLGTSWTTDSETSAINDTFATQADGSTAWDKTAVDSHSFGLRGS